MVYLSSLNWWLMCSVGIGMRSGKDKHPESICKTSVTLLNPLNQNEKQLGNLSKTESHLSFYRIWQLMAKLLNVFPKSLQYLAHCFDKGGEENQITTAEICDWWNFLPNPPPPIKKKKEKRVFKRSWIPFSYTPKKKPLPPHKMKQLWSHSKGNDRTHCFNINFYESLLNDN